MYSTYKEAEALNAWRTLWESNFTLQQFSVAVFNNLGVLYMKQREWEKACVLFEQGRTRGAQMSGPKADGAQMATVNLALCLLQRARASHSMPAQVRNEWRARGVQLLESMTGMQPQPLVTLNGTVHEPAPTAFVPALLTLGLCHLEGLGVFRDENEAFCLLYAAARRAYTPAVQNLAICFAQSIGVTRSLPHATALFATATGMMAFCSLLSVLSGCLLRALYNCWRNQDVLVNNVLCLVC
jgi:TPR repeat protein